MAHTYLRLTEAHLAEQLIGWQSNTVDYGKMSAAADGYVLHSTHRRARDGVMHSEVRARCAALHASPRTATQIRLLLPSKASDGPVKQLTLLFL